MVDSWRSRCLRRLCAIRVAVALVFLGLSGSQAWFLASKDGPVLSRSSLAIRKALYYSRDDKDISSRYSNETLDGSTSRSFVDDAAEDYLLWIPKSPTAAEKMINDEIGSKGEEKQREECDSLTRAIGQVHAILDLYEDSNVEDDGHFESDAAISLMDHYYLDEDYSGVESTKISTNVVLTVVENVILSSMATQCDPTDFTYWTTDSLAKLEELVWRCRKVGLAPSVLVMDSLWMMHEYQLHKSVSTSDGNVASTYPSENSANEYTHRAVKLLHHWFEWARSGDLAPQPGFYFIKLLEFARQQKVSMSERYASLHWTARLFDSKLTCCDSMWGLYCTAHSQNLQSCRRSRASEYLKESLSFSVPCRAYELMSSMLSEFDWQEKHCRVLRDRIDLAFYDDDYSPTTTELWDALKRYAVSGRAQDTAWLVRVLQHEADSSLLERYFVQSLLQSTQRGSLQYMEHFVLSTQRASHRGPPSNSTRQMDSFRMLLQKWSQAQMPGAGMRAEAVFRVVEDIYRDSELDSSWCPDEECVYYVVTAYLQEHSVSLSHVMDADRFVRDCVAKMYLMGTTETISSLNDNSNSSQCFPIFGRLLQAYKAYSPTDPAKARERADKLFCFLLIQHRDRAISEEPGPDHFRHLLSQFRRAPASARRSLEYYQLLTRLHGIHILSVPPDVSNARQVLSILARSNQTDFGESAESILHNVQDSTHDKELHDSWSRMVWCVVACHCKKADGKEGVEAAIRVLVEADLLHSSLWTRASHRTLLNALRCMEGGGSVRGLERWSSVANDTLTGRKTM